MSDFEVKFWGVRGSVPSPLTPAQVSDKIRHAIDFAKRGVSFDELSFAESSTFGGNTTCVSVKCGDELFILDMGTGIRELGKAQMKELFSRSQIGGTVVEATILQSHVHWDHINGFPFYAPIYLDRRKFSSQLNFYGGKQWDSQLDLAYRGQMDAPYFPVNLQELERTGAHMSFQTIYDGWQELFGDTMLQSVVKVKTRKLNHPQETFGYRIEYEGKSIAFTTDHEPYDPLTTPAGLAELIQGVDLWITDCQYTHDQYIGKKGPQRFGWGHCHERFIANVAASSGVKKVITTHHDPDASDYDIIDIAADVQKLSKVETAAAYEGLTISF